jgi:hypothetical protein
MHGDAAGRALEQAGATIATGTRIDDVGDLDADAVVLATPPEHSSARRSSACTLLFDRVLLQTPLAALLDSDAHWSSTAAR